jgi:hypothetical protein
MAEIGLNAAKRLGGPEIMKGTAQAHMNAELHTMWKTPLNLSQTELTRLKKYVDAEVISTYAIRNTSDHAIIGAARMMLSDVLKDKMPHNTDVLRTLHIGATTTDLKRYRAHGSHQFEFSMREGRDRGRIFESLACEVSKRLDNLKKPAFGKPGSAAVTLKIDSIEEALKLLEHASPGGRRIYCGETPKTEKFSRLIFSDSLYSFSEKELCRRFRETGATCGYAIMLLPEIFRDASALPSDLYDLEYSLDFAKLNEVIKTLWPGVLAALVFVPIDALEHAVMRALNFLVQHGQTGFLNWLTGMASTPFPLIDKLAQATGPEL